MPRFDPAELAIANPLVLSLSKDERPEKAHA